jgi:hypothetical protein
MTMTPTTVRDNLKALSAYLYESSGPDFMYEAVEQAIVLLEGWRPIETAPKDGTKVDLWRLSDKWQAVAEGRRITDAWFADGRWRHEDYDYGHERSVSGHITHWMPLPEGPK